MSRNPPSHKYQRGSLSTPFQKYGLVFLARTLPHGSWLVTCPYARGIRALASRARQQAIVTALAGWWQRSLTVAARKLPSRDTCACEPRASASDRDCFSGVVATLPHGRGS